MLPNCNNCIHQHKEVCNTCSAYHGYKFAAKDPDYMEDGVPAIQTDSWVEGIWDDIDTKPIYIRDKKHLFQECEKRGHLPKAFMKPKSQGHGWELKRR